VTTTPSSEVPPVLVREATPADLAAIRNLIAAAGLPLAGLDDAALVLVAAADGAVVGTVALERHGTGSDTVFLLRSAAVAPAWRGRGVGAELTAAALAHVDAAEAPVALLTETAAGYFPPFGFAAVPRDRLPAALAASAELQGACPASARALLRPAVASATDESGGR
jgi:amino-acid N-acetyltransferase